MTAVKPLVLDALIHDLAIVLRGSLHPSAEIGPPARLASRRLQEVLGIEDGSVTTWTVQARLREAFAVAEAGDERCPECHMPLTMHHDPMCSQPCGPCEARHPR